MAVDGGNRPVQALDQGEEARVRDPSRRRTVIAVQQAAVTGERLGPNGITGKAQPGGVEHPDQHVVDVVLTGTATTERVRSNGTRHAPHPAQTRRRSLLLIGPHTTAES